jgi:preprotein translocase subunit SecD
LKNFSWKLVLVFGVIVTAIIYVLPTFQPGLWPHNQINLGLDLQGGMHLVLEVDTAKAVEGQVERISQFHRKSLTSSKKSGFGKSPWIESMEPKSLLGLMIRQSATNLMNS